MSAALAPRTDCPDRYPVPYVGNKQMNDPVPEARENLLILNIQRDVTDLRAEVRAINGQIESFRNRVDARFEKAEQRREGTRRPSTPVSTKSISNAAKTGKPSTLALTKSIPALRQ